MSKIVYGFRLFGPTRTGSFEQYRHVSIEIEPFEVRDAGEDLLANIGYGGTDGYYEARATAARRENVWCHKPKLTYYKPEDHRRVCFTWQADNKTEDERKDRPWYACEAKLEPRADFQRMLGKIIGKLPADKDGWYFQPWEVLAALRALGMKPIHWIETDRGGSMFFEIVDFDWSAQGLRGEKLTPALPVA